jgi:hypothetical protein
MLEQETGVLIRTVAERTIGEGVTVSVKEILAADIPHPIKTFFRTDVDSMLAEELHRYHKTSRFNFDSVEVHTLEDQMNAVLVLNYSFPRSEYLQRLDEAVHMLGNFLIRPQWTLTNALFEHEQTISAATLARLLRHFGPYEYLRSLITQHIGEKKVSSFSRADFSGLLSRLDGDFIRRKAGDEMARLMSPMYDFFDYPESTGSNRLPVKALIRYFEDKGLKTVLSRLEGETRSGHQELALRELGALLEDVRRTSGAFEVEQRDAGRTAAPDRSGSGSGQAASDHGHHRRRRPAPLYQEDLQPG